MTEDRDWYTLRQAAARVDRSRTTIRRWKRNGMPVTLDHGMYLVAHDDLLTWLRQTVARDQVGRRKDGTRTLRWYHRRFSERA